MTTRQRTVRTLLAVVFVAILGGAIAASIHLSLTSAAASTQRADSHAAEAEDLRAQLDAVTAERDQARTQADDLRADVDALQDALDAASGKDAAGEPVPPRFYEDGSWVAGEMSGCAPSALCDDAYQDTLDED